MLTTTGGIAQVEFHISRFARDRYHFDASLFSLHGNVIFANFHAARIFAQKINEKRDLVRFPEQAVKAGQINALGLIDEILHFVIGQYRKQINPEVMAQALAALSAKLGSDRVDAALRRFAVEFPALSVYHRETTVDAYLDGATGGVPHRQIVLEEMLMLWIANMNPATATFMELFDDTTIEKETAYLPVIAALHEFFDRQPHFGPDNQNLIDMLRAPAIAVPHSLPGQLEDIITRWRSIMGGYLYRLLASLDFIKEEEKPDFAGFGAGEKRVVDYGLAGAGVEVERFTPDRDWMPRVVLIVKNVYVWFEQLVRKYGRPIYQLDHIPDEELDILARWGFTGLWLIGIWERSPASRQIKQIMGNADAVASAYSLNDYSIARDLGGEAALTNLRERAWRRGIRLASDMVPNHMGIDSHWVAEHPDWFVASDWPPFPSYTFNGPNLSNDSRIGIYLEDHYYSCSDAAVVFKRVDHHNDGAKYIYHGNDGTSLPWSDTAQLNYLIPEVREAVIQTILHVARNFPIIRFDAAMTLSKEHYQRLWFPEPGTGGAIASRADFSMTKAQFNTAMPVEFWREVVDRAAVEAPDTLLLAEAFWLMESYFVRTLGMHRVYNSAFMNILRDEENAKYRQIIKNTLEFDPEILKRLANFMNNPDERTAVDQFGKGDKYFGVCVLMVTLPGLPMFGHGQIEGFAEKYGMEFRRALWDETPDLDLVQRHERLIFPLLHKRYIFAEVRDFLLYDFFMPDGHVDENVLAYSNRHDGERGLVIYHNKFASTRGWIRTSAAAYAIKLDGGKRLMQRTLSEGLDLRANENDYLIFRDQVTSLEYIRKSKEISRKGFYVELDAYKFHVFLDFREVADNEWHQYAHLTAYLDGRGVPSMEEALRELFLQAIHYPFKELVNAGLFCHLSTIRPEDSQADLDDIEGRMLRLLRAIKHLMGGSGDEASIAREVRSKLEIVLQLADLARTKSASQRTEVIITNQSLLKSPACLAYLLDNWRDDTSMWGVLFGWLFVHELGRVISEDGFEQRSRSGIEEWQLGRIVAGTLLDFGLDEPMTRWAVTVIRAMTAQQRWFAAGDSAHHLLSVLLMDDDVRRFLQIHRYQDLLWFNKESFEQILWWLMIVAAVTVDRAWTLQNVFDVICTLREAGEQSDYQVEKLLEKATRLAP